MLKEMLRDNKYFLAMEKESGKGSVYSAGALKAFWSWKNSVHFGNNELEVSDFIWDKNVTEFVNTLREAGIKSFVVTNQSTALMQNLHAFVENGCELVELCVFKRGHGYFKDDPAEELYGIRFKVGEVD